MAASIQPAKGATSSSELTSMYVYPLGPVPLRSSARSRLSATSGGDQQTSSCQLPSRDVAREENIDRRVLAVEEAFKTTDLSALKCLAEGGYGAVYKIKPGLFSRPYAVKTVKPELPDKKRKEAIDSIRKEAEYLKILKHRNVISIVHTFEYQNAVVLIMPVAGGDLSNYLRKHSGRLSKRNIRRLITDVCAGVSYLHGQVCLHRDIKGKNILLVDNVWKISDFGFVIRQAENEKRRVGTSAYWSPEVFHAKQYSMESDYWAMGVMFMQACAHPFDRVRYLIEKNKKVMLVYKTFQEFEQACYNMLFRRINLHFTSINYRLNEEVNKYCTGFDRVFDQDHRPNVAVIRCLPDFHARCLVYILALLREDPAKRITPEQFSHYITL